MVSRTRSLRARLQRPTTASAGVSLIEVLVTLLVMTIGLVGIVSMQTYSLRQISNSALRTQGNLLIQELAEMIRVNPANGASFSTAGLTGGKIGPVNAASDCPTGQLALFIQEWCRTLSRTLPGAEATVTWDAGTANIMLIWPEKAMISSGTSNTTLRYQVRAPNAF